LASPQLLGRLGSGPIGGWGAGRWVGAGAGGYARVMPKPEHLGHAALVGWRKRLADVTAPPVASRAPASEDQVRAVIGGVLFAASLYYVVSTLVRVARTARG